jgi:hypothetical protein
VGKAGKKNTTTFEQEPALEEARKLLRLLYPEVILDGVSYPSFLWGTPLGGNKNAHHYLSPLLDKDWNITKIGGPRDPHRDAAIVAVLARLAVKYKIPLTLRRGGLHRRPSACAIVARALGGIGVNLKEAGVESVWSKRRPHLAPHEIDALSRLPRWT